MTLTALTTLVIFIFANGASKTISTDDLDCLFFQKLHQERMLFVDDEGEERMRPVDVVCLCTEGE